MAKIPFDINKRPEIEAGKFKVFFADKPARIICWDKKNSKEGALVVALVDDGKSEHTEYCYPDGQALGINSPSLWLAPAERELTGFEMLLYDWCSSDTGGTLSNERLREVAINRAEMLLTAAQRQLCCICKSRSDGYKNGLEEARKDLPRWRTSALDFEHGAIGETIDGRDVLSYKGYEIILEDIFEKLPKEDEK